MTNARVVSCDVYNRIFCHEITYQQHKLREHSGGTFNSNSNNLDTPIFLDIGHSQTIGYQEKIDELFDMICTHRMNGKDWITITKQLPTNYTYGDLKTLLDEVRRNEHGAFKINIGFGSILYDTVNKMYRYYYISSNHYLFDRAYIISTNHDMTDFFDRILSLNLTEKYYFQRPSSGWVLVGLPNMEIRVMRIRDVPIGAGVPLPAYIKSSKSIVSLTHSKNNGYDFNDNLCMFRCLALHFGASIRSLEGPTNRLKQSLE